jgi:hypothetical protein
MLLFVRNAANKLAKPLAVHVLMSTLFLDPTILGLLSKG